MIGIWQFMFLTLCHAVFASIPNVEPEYLNMLRETGQHEEFARLLGLEDVSLVHPVEGRTEEDLMFTNVSPLGDILLTPEQEEQARQGINLNRHPSSKWQNHVVPYEIGRSEFTKKQRKDIDNALRDLTKILQNIKIVPRTNQKDYVLIINGNGCYSRLGKTGGQQVVSLQSNGCLRRGTIMHEFIHAMGMLHEQSRPDRDNYVRVLFENIPEEWKSQYRKVDARSYDILGPYDAYSVMHYPMQAPNGKPAFEFKFPVDTTLVGQRVKPTDKDKKKVDKLYSN